MLQASQEELLKSFANASDELFSLKIIRTDSFTGEIGEYFASLAYNFSRTAKVTRAVDGKTKNGEKYQVKAKVTTGSLNYHVKNLETHLFDFLVIVFLDLNYIPITIIRIPSNHIENNEINISNLNIDMFEHYNLLDLNTPEKAIKTINRFAELYNALISNGVIRSRRIVGDIGEYYACQKLNLQLSDNKNEKGIDARHTNGLTFEIKTRRVYESDRRKGKTRRINNLAGKFADYLIVVTLDRLFLCSGMWLIPLNNIENPKSANLNIVNSAPGTLNVVPSKIKWLNSGKKFISFDIIKTKEKKTSSKRSSIRARQKSYSAEFDLGIINRELRASNSNCKDNKRSNLILSRWEEIKTSIKESEYFVGWLFFILIVTLLLFYLRSL